MPRTGTSSESELPVTLDWYRQAANWLVGLSTGAIAASLTFMDKLRPVGLVVRVLFVFAGVCFL